MLRVDHCVGLNIISRLDQIKEEKLWFYHLTDIINHIISLKHVFLITIGLWKFLIQLLYSPVSPLLLCILSYLIFTWTIWYPLLITSCLLFSSLPWEYTAVMNSILLDIHLGYLASSPHYKLSRFTQLPWEYTAVMNSILLHIYLGYLASSPHHKLPRFTPLPWEHWAVVNWGSGKAYKF